MTSPQAAAITKLAREICDMVMDHVDREGELEYYDKEQVIIPAIAQALARARAEVFKDIIKRAQYRLTSYDKDHQTAHELRWMIQYCEQQAPDGERTT